MPAAADHFAGLLRRCRFPAPGTLRYAAVSGGADSLALLVLARAADLDVVAVHVDHGLRLGSSEEAAAVAAAADRLGARFEATTVHVEPGPDLEARARRARYDALPTGVMTGHTADDQAETVLLNVLRGSGIDGLSAMADTARVRRPLLALRRSETRDVTCAAGLIPFEDPSNVDPRFRRNQVRRRLLPLMEEIGDRDPVPLLARLAAVAAADVEILEGMAADIDPTDAAAVAAAPEALARRALRRWLRVGAEAHPPSSAELTRALAVATGAALACELSGGRRLRRSAGRLTLEQPRRLAGSVGPAMERPAR